MGKRAGKFKPHKHGNKKVKNEWTSPTIPQDNPLFKAYYQLQLRLPQEEFEVFWTTMKEKLPVVFRINPSTPNYSAFRDKIQHPDFLKTMLDEKEVEPEEAVMNEPKEVPKIEILPWYPGNVLHQINTTKQIFKKSKILNNLHQYLQKAFDAGLIARQELVSMLPPLFLDVHHDDIILDMCAAPGSKTSQLLEMIYGEERGLTKGCVIANDADYSRAQMLIHQINRSGTAGMAVINHPGQFLPELYSGKVDNIKQKFQFDKVLCDVPCSGDGATRKIPIKWAKWHTSDGASLHPLQLAILMKSINLLKRGGLIVYSTCSLNPIENEAVLSALFSKVAKGLEIIDIHNVYGVIGRRGAYDWKVCGSEYVTKKVMAEGEEREEKVRQIKIYDSFAEVKDHKIKESMFPPSLEEAQRIQLQNSMRILPHDQNSGGFFVALLKKHEDFEWKYSQSKKEKLVDEKEEANEEAIRDEEFVDNNLPEMENDVVNEEGQGEKIEEEDVEEEEEEEEDEKPEKKMEEEGKDRKGKEKEKEKKTGSKYEKFENVSEAEFDGLQKFFGLDPILKDLLFVRDGDGTARKKVLLVSEGVKRFLDADQEKKIKLVNMGCKVFEKGKESFAGYECLYRLSQQGIHFLIHLMSQRKVRVTLDFFRSVLSIHSLVHEDIKDVEIREKIKQMSQGSFCIYIDQVMGGKRVVDAMVGQNFKSSFHLMVGKEELASLNLRYL